MSDTASVRSNRPICLGSCYVDASSSDSIYKTLDFVLRRDDLEMIDVTKNSSEALSYLHLSVLAPNSGTDSGDGLLPIKGIEISVIKASAQKLKESVIGSMAVNEEAKQLSVKETKVKELDDQPTFKSPVLSPDFEPEIDEESKGLVLGKEGQEVTVDLPFTLSE